MSEKSTEGQAHDALAAPPRVRKPCCEDTSLDTRLRKGRRAMAITSDITVRTAPGRGSGVLGELRDGEIVTILDGPACVGGIVWWQIQYGGDNAWIAEGWETQGGYFLIPVR